MKIRIFTILLVAFCSFSYGQEEMSKADILYFEYAYEDAIEEYKKEMLSKPLSSQQFANLAASYFNTDNYKKAAETFFDLYKTDYELSANHFNMMLQAMNRTDDLERVNTLLATRVSSFPVELMENAELNYELLHSNDTTAGRFRTFNIDSNSPQDDFAPGFYGEKLLFSSGRVVEDKSIYSPSGESYLNIYVARMSADGSILNPNLFTGIPKTKFHQATPFYSDKLDQVFYILSNAEEGELLFDENGKNALAIGTVSKRGDFLYLLRDLSTSFYYPFYDAASERLYFSASLKDSYGGTDLYYVSTNNGMIMSSPVNLGPRINSPGNEIAPYIFDGSLYFASDIFYGLGGMDIYKSEVQADDLFSIPINLGYGINSESDDFGMIIKKHEDQELIGYFASNREGGKGGDDIYGFLAKEMPGPKILLLKGNIVNPSTGNAVSKVMLKLIDSEQKKIKEIFADEDGNFRVEIPWQEELTIEARKPKHSQFSLSLNNEQLLELQQQELTIEMSSIDDLVIETEDQQVIKLNKFFFAKGSATITPEIEQELEKVVNIVAQFPQLQLRIESHTDSRGGSSTNFRISQNRADAIKKYLQENGVPSSNILYSVGYGEDKIINQCENGVYCLDFLHRQNERHLIVILNYNLLE
ncbi:MAG: OmpA family protein [Flavobacteriaceae bacterium]